MNEVDDIENNDIDDMDIISGKKEFALQKISKFLYILLIIKAIVILI